MRGGMKRSTRERIVRVGGLKSFEWRIVHQKNYHKISGGLWAGSKCTIVEIWWWYYTQFKQRQTCPRVACVVLDSRPTPVNKEGCNQKIRHWSVTLEGEECALDSFDQQYLPSRNHVSQDLERGWRSQSPLGISYRYVTQYFWGRRCMTAEITVIWFLYVLEDRHTDDVMT